MLSYSIITDAASALMPSQCEELSILVLPMGVNLNGKEFDHYSDAREMGFKDFYNALRSGATSGTTAVNPDEWIRKIESELKSGQDVLCIPFSSALSSTFENACMAAEELRENYPERKIFVVDSKSADFGQGLFVVAAAKNRADGMTIEDNASWCLDNYSKFCHWFTVDDLHHLSRGGRISATTAIVGSALGIKPLLHVDNEGRLINVGKVRGRKKALLALVDKAEATAIEPSKQTMFLSHADSLDEAEFVANELKTRLKVPEVVIHYTAPIAGAHSGPGTMALFFIGKER